MFAYQCIYPRPTPLTTAAACPYKGTSANRPYYIFSQLQINLIGLTAQTLFIHPFHDHSRRDYDGRYGFSQLAPTAWPDTAGAVAIF